MTFTHWCTERLGALVRLITDTIAKALTLERLAKGERHLSQHSPGGELDQSYHIPITISSRKGASDKVQGCGGQKIYQMFAKLGICRRGGIIKGKVAQPQGKPCESLAQCEIEKRKKDQRYADASRFPSHVSVRTLRAERGYRCRSQNACKML